MANLKTLEKRLRDAEAAFEAVLTPYHKLEKRVQAAGNKARRAREAYDKARSEAGQLDDIRTLIRTYDPWRGSMEHHRAMDKWAHAHGLLSSGYWSDTNEPAFTVMVKHNQSDLKALTDTLVELVGIHTPIKGWVQFGVMERGLSRHVMFMLYVKPDSHVARLERNSYGSHSDLIQDSIPNVLAYMAKHCWYDSGDSDDSDSED